MKRKRLMGNMLAVVLGATMMFSMSMNTFAGEWKKDDTGWWYQNEDSTWPKDEWKLIDGQWYYFWDNGYMAEDTWIYYYNGYGRQWYHVTKSGAMATSGDYITGSVQENGRFEEKHRVYWDYEMNHNTGGVGVKYIDLTEEDKKFWKDLLEKYGYDKLQKEENEEGVSYVVDFTKMPHADELVAADSLNLIRAKAYFDGYRLEAAQALGFSQLSDTTWKYTVWNAYN